MGEGLPFTDEERELYVGEHNKYRRMQGASNMLMMEWDHELEEFASNYVL